MNRRLSPRTYPLAVLCTLLALLRVGAPSASAAMQQPAIKQVSPPSSTAPPTDALPAVGSDPFTMLAEEIAAGKNFIINFRRTELDTKAEATAQVAVRGQTLLVRMRARNLPLPSHFEVPRYALWVYITNYEVKMYIGDLPVRPTGRLGDMTRRGEADSAYRFPGLPPGAIFGGLLLTAEPARYTPVINQALRPLLIGLIAEANIEDTGAPTTDTAGPLPAGTK